MSADRNVEPSPEERARQIAYWNQAAKTKDFTTNLRIDEFSKYVSKRDFVVDVGCGYGRILAELHRLGYARLVGFDPAEAMIHRGKVEHPYLDLRLMNGEVLDLPNRCADAILLMGVLTCIASDTVQDRLLNEIFRILKSGGILYVSDFLLNRDERNLIRYEKYKDLYGIRGVFALPEGALLRHHSEERIQNLLDRFEQKEYHRLTFNTMNGHTSNGFFYIGIKKEA